MSDAKAKALARQQRILAKSQARMAVAKGEAAVLSESSVVLPESTGGEPTAPLQPDTVQESLEQTVTVEGSPNEGKDPIDTDEVGDVVTSGEPGADAAVAPVVEQAGSPAKEKRSTGRVLASRREKIQARQAAASAAPAPSPSMAADPADALLEDAMKECLGEKGEHKPHAAAATPTPEPKTKPKLTTGQAPEDGNVPTIAEHATAVNDKQVLKESKQKGRGFIRLSKATIVHLVNFVVLLSVSCMNGYYADVRALHWAAVDATALKAFVHASTARGGASVGFSVDEFTDSLDGGAFDQFAPGSTWGQTIYVFLGNFAACLFENSFLCVFVVHWFIVPKIIPVVEHVLLLFGIVDSDIFSSSGAACGGASLVSRALSLFMGGVTGIISSVLDVFSYVALHCVLSIGFSVLFAHYCKGLAADLAFLGDGGGVSGGNEL